MRTHERCFKTLEPLSCIACDTLRPFTVTVKKNGEPINASSSQSMTLTICDVESPTVPVVTKVVTPIDGKFVIQITSEDTAKLNGDYILVFSLHENDGMIYRKAAGKLHVFPAPRG